MYICICFIYTRFFRDIENFNQEINIGKCNLKKFWNFCQKCENSPKTIMLSSWWYIAYVHVLYIQNTRHIYHSELEGLYTCTFLTRGSLFDLFQVVDMRWGVRDEATDDHMTTHLCMQEIDNCQRLSIGPNFIVSNVWIKESWSFNGFLRFHWSLQQILNKCNS